VVPANRVPELGPEQLKALTHPLRVAMLKALRTDGPATATALAKRLGESSGATSYHLRRLEWHGFVEEDPERGNGRDRWWRAAFAGHSVEPARYLDDPEASVIVGEYQRVVVDSYAERAHGFVGEQNRGEWSAEWVAAANLSDYSLRLTPAQLARLNDKVDALLRSFERYDSPGAERVLVQWLAFPRRVRPFVEEAE
jgi:DNA-binding transcriptional ArsR family regulator